MTEDGIIIIGLKKTLVRSSLSRLSRHNHFLLRYRGSYKHELMINVRKFVQA